MKSINNNMSEELFVNISRQREMSDLLRHRKSLLDGEDKLMMKMYLENGHSYRQIARMFGVSSSTISYRIKRISKMLSGESFYIYRNCRKKLNNEYKELARDYFLAGLSIRQISKKRCCGRKKVKKEIEKILNLVEAEQQLTSIEFRQWLIRHYFRPVGIEPD